jgi:hypothetical protein
MHLAADLKLPDLGVEGLANLAAVPEKSISIRLG